jgi:hypothetical protein
MPTLPWTATDEARRPGPGADGDAVSDAPAGPVVVLASRFVLTSRRHTFRFMRYAMRIRSQVLRSPGALGLSLIAQPFGRTYWTLSAWTDQESLDTFVGTSPHRDGMAALHPLMREAAFTTWTTGSDTLPARWSEAKERLANGR